jgi:peptide-methionine (R)-S-oxide reductase
MTQSDRPAPKKELTAEQKAIAFREATERAFTGPWLNEKREGVYRCVVCDAPLWGSDAKYDSGSGWPSFTRPIRTGAVETKTDYKIGVPRTEVHCANCGAHMGHVFDDGPGPEGQRYCINGSVLDFTASADAPKTRDPKASDPKTKG